MTTTAYLAHVLGWTLLHFCWQGTAIVVLLACTLSLLRQGSAQLRYVVCCAAMVLSLATAAVTFERIASRDAARLHGIGTDPGVRVEVSPGELIHAATSRLSFYETRLDQALPAVVLVWSLGFAICLARLSAGVLAAKNMRFVGTAPAGAEETALFHELCVRMGMQRPIQLLRSAVVQTPAVVGWLRPAVLIPMGALAGLSLTQMEALLAHELAHIRRHDYLVNVLQSLAESLLFYHPAVWWISRQIRKERELCCDDIAVRYTGDPVRYARALYLLAEHRAASPVVTLSANGGFLTMRIQRLLRPNHTSGVQPFAALSALGVLLAVAGVCLGTAQAQRSLTAVDRMAMLHSLTGVHAAVDTVSESAPEILISKMGEPAQPSLPVADLSTLWEGDQSKKEKSPATVAAGVMAGQLVTKVNPVYPAVARAKEIQGAVVLKARIAKDGAIKNLQVVKGPTELMDSAIEAVRQWKYKPYVLNGEPVEVDTTITVNYTLGSGVPLSSVAPCTRQTTECKMPVLLYGPEPEFPAEARAQNVTGEVIVQLRVDEKGNPQDVSLVSPDGYGFGEKAIEAVRRYRFQPATRNGTPAVAELKVAVNFLAY